MHSHSRPIIMNGSINMPSDSDIIIRRYQDADQHQVQAIFRRGMEQVLVPALANKLVADPIFFVPVGGLACMVKWVTAKMMGSTSKQQCSSASNFTIIPWLAGAGFVTATVLVVYGIGARMVEGYIQHSIKTDLSDIPGVYFAKGGTFLLAQQTTSGKIVGCVEQRVIIRDIV